MIGLPKMQAVAFSLSLRVKRRSLADTPRRDVSHREEFGAPGKKESVQLFSFGMNGGDGETRTRDLLTASH
jgi:hypothetical protein